MHTRQSLVTLLALMSAVAPLRAQAIPDLEQGVFIRVTHRTAHGSMESSGATSAPTPFWAALFGSPSLPLAGSGAASRALPPTHPKPPTLTNASRFHRSPSRPRVSPPGRAKPARSSGGLGEGAS